MWPQASRRRLSSVNPSCDPGLRPWVLAVLGWALLFATIPDAGAQVINITDPQVRVSRNLLNEDIAEGSVISMGSTPVGTSDTQTFQIFNDGGGDPLLISNFTVSGTCFRKTMSPTTSPIPPGETTLFQVRFLCSTAGTYTGTVTFNSNDPTEPTFSFQVRATAYQPATLAVVDVTTASDLTAGQTVTLPVQTPSDSTVRTFRLENRGDVGLSLQNRDSIISGQCFTQTSTPPSILGSGGSALVDVTYACGSVGTHTATATVQSNDPAQPTFTWQIQGSVVDPPRDRATALWFDGVDDYVWVGDPPALDLTTTLTLEAWVWPSSAKSGTGIVINKESSYQLGVAGNGTVRWAFDNTSPDWTWINTTGVVPRDAWSHVAVTYDQGEVLTYINGDLVHTYAGSGPIDPSNQSFRVGGREGSTGMPFLGALDEVRVWNTARTQAQIIDTMHRPPAAGEPGLVADWRFDQGEGDLAMDSSASVLQGTLVGGPAWVADDRPPFQAAAVGPTFTDVMILSADTDLHGPAALTMEAWILPRVGSGSGRLVNQEGEYRMSLSPASEIRWSINNTVPGWQVVNTGVPIPEGVWSHVAVTYDGAQIKTYLDGVLVHSQAGSGPIQARDPAMGFRLGGWITTLETAFHGLIDEARVWNVARTATEISDSRFTRLTGAEPGLLGSWDFDGSDGVKVADRARDHRLTFGGVSSLVADDRMAVSRALSLDGAGDWVHFGSGGALHPPGSTVTVEAWVRPTAGSLGGAVIAKELEYLLGLSDAHTLRWALNTASPGWIWIDTGVPVPDGTWSHVAVAYDGAIVRSYLDGQEVHSQAASGAFTDGQKTFRIGAREHTNGLPFHYFTGDVDEVRVWSTARTASEILAAKDRQLVGDEAGLLGYWNFDDDGSFAWDSTAAGTAGSLIGNAFRSLGGGTGPAGPPSVADPVFTYWWDHEDYRSEPVVWWTLDPNKSPAQLQAELGDTVAHQQRFQQDSTEPLTAEELAAIRVYVNGAQRSDLVPAWVAFAAFAEDPPKYVETGLVNLGVSEPGLQQILDQRLAFQVARDQIEGVLAEPQERLGGLVTAAETILGDSAAAAALATNDLTTLSANLGVPEVEVTAILWEGRRSSRLEAAVDSLQVLSSNLSTQDWEGLRTLLLTEVAPQITMLYDASTNSLIEYKSHRFNEGIVDGGKMRISVEGSALFRRESRRPINFTLDCGINTLRLTTLNGSGATNNDVARTDGADLSKPEVRNSPTMDEVLECKLVHDEPICWSFEGQPRSHNFWMGFVKGTIINTFWDITVGRPIPRSPLRGFECDFLSIGGQVNMPGLSSTIQVGLQLVGTDENGARLFDRTMTRSGPGPFEFDNILRGTHYQLLYTGASTGSVTCSVTNGSGVADTENVTDIQLDCTCPDPPSCGGLGSSRVRIGGTLTDLPEGKGIVIQAERVPVASPGSVEVISTELLSGNGPWLFEQGVELGDQWRNAVVSVQPAGLYECRVNAGSQGTVVTDGQSDVKVSCACNHADCEIQPPGRSENRGPFVDHPGVPSGGSGGGGGGSDCQGGGVITVTTYPCGTGPDGSVRFCDNLIHFGCKNATVWPSVVNSSSPDTTVSVSAVSHQGDQAVSNGWLDVEVTGWDMDGIEGFVLGVDGQQRSDSFRATPVSEATASWPQVDVSGLTNGSHTLEVIVIDAHPTDPSYTNFQMPFIVDNSGTATSCPRPTSQLLSPVEGSEVSGVVDVTMAGATQLGSVDTVTLRVDGVDHTVRSGPGPHHVAWDTGGLASGVHTLMVVVTNSCGLSKASPQVTVTVEGDTNHNPIAQDDQVTVQGTTPTVISVTANDTDPDGDQVVLVGAANFLVIPPVHGTVVKVGPGEVEYQAAPGFAGQDTFQYEVGDNRGRRARAWVTVEVELPEARFPILADAWVNGSSAYQSVNYGAEGWLRVRTSAGGHGRHSYLKFQVSGVSGVVHSAKLRIKTRVQDIPSMGVWSVPDTAWTEAGVTWENAPIDGARLVVETGPLAARTWHEIDVTSMITGDGLYTIALATSEDLSGLTLHSRESGQAPELIVTYEP